MNAILEQLGLDQTFFIQFAIFAVLFFILTPLYFRPFMRLFQLRHERTVQDRQAAEKLIAQAQAKLEEYKKVLTDERAKARKEYEDVVNAAKKEESSILSAAREQAKKITQGTAESVAQQREELKQAIEKDVETLAQSISEKLLSRKV